MQHSNKILNSSDLAKILKSTRKYSGNVVYFNEKEIDRIIKRYLNLIENSIRDYPHAVETSIISFRTNRLYNVWNKTKLLDIYKVKYKVRSSKSKIPYPLPNPLPEL